MNNLEKMKNLLENCRKGNHQLEKIYESGNDQLQDVIRWCKICGSVVGDVDADGRISPGKLMKMKRPGCF